MQYEEVLRLIEERAARGLDRERAATAAAATLVTLADCLSPDAARRLAAQLPTELEPRLRRTGGGARPSTLEGFLDAVAAREQLSRSEAFDDARAVFDALAEAVTAAELEHVRTQLPEELQTLFEPPAATRWPETHAARRDDA